MIRSFSQIPTPGYTEVAAHRKSQAESRQWPCEFSRYTWPIDGHWRALLCFHFILLLPLHLQSLSHVSQYLRKSLKDILWQLWREIIPGMVVIYLDLLMNQKKGKGISGDNQITQHFIALPLYKMKCGPIKGKGDDGTHLTSLTSTDAIVISGWLVLTDKTGLVNTRGWKWWRRARNKLLRTGALSFNCWKRKKIINWMIH